jgi:LCP family protein required for cell wall assembly
MPSDATTDFGRRIIPQVDGGANHPPKFLPPNNSAHLGRSRSSFGTDENRIMRRNSAQINADRLGGQGPLPNDYYTQKSADRASGSRKLLVTPNSEYPAGSTGDPFEDPAIRKKRKRIRRRRIFLALFVIVLALVGITAYWAWSTYNDLKNSIQRVPALSSMLSSSDAEIFLIVGNDSRSAEAEESDVEGARADTIMLLVHSSAGVDSLISIPRDTRVLLPAFTDQLGNFGMPGQEIDPMYAKINAAYSYGGPELLVRAVEDLTRQKVDHYAELGFDGLTSLIDAVGGINLCYDDDVDDNDSGMQWEAGCHDVDGGEALAYSRMRHQDPEGDIGRAKRQRNVIHELAGKVMQVKNDGKPTNLWNINPLLDIAHSGLKTIKFDERTSPQDMLHFATYFQNATGANGYQDVIPIENPIGYDAALGSVVIVDDDAVKDYFLQLIDGEIGGK